ncbi:MarR family winged helix-turn-helix transcriptional regulator [Pandoraea apista]|uniref:MarR family transcriptional regulator n=1 Tax=Pandoraea apista TaxID=93218 RepID=A0A0G4JM64_9BURK|nr:MarR family transcriptional regulator [Pandoraea apista]AVF41204.1 MarR family transcriptional regulator [Pandoraea apista]OXS88818.1 transcriptional regulator [Pandoraea apista]PTE00918.1 MarR family transcriptional regulator [Pandoraea apista]RRJ26398.1 MarR family transcriptional regulator [Pandoraea apista]RRJ79715.1 MarR family transcriptional regulator [Pandoraea apista]
MARFISDTGVLMRGHGESATQISEPAAMRETGNGFTNGHSHNTYGAESGAAAGATSTASPLNGTHGTMSDRHTNRNELVAGIVRSLGRRLAVYTALYHSALAEQLGLNVTDLNALDLILELESITAGQLAELMGVSSGGITTVIDRLERAGFVEREKNPHDRRMVMIHPIEERCAQIEQFLSSVSRELTAVSAAYDHSELAAIHDFLVQSIRTLKSETFRLRFEADQDIAGLVSNSRNATTKI